MRWLWCTHASLRLLLAQCILVFIALSQSLDDGSLTVTQNQEKSSYIGASFLEKDSSADRMHQDASRYLVNTAQSQDSGKQSEAARSPTFSSQSPSPSLASTSEPSKSRDTAGDATTKRIATSTTLEMVLDLQEPVRTTKFLQSVVLLSVAMCDTLTCPVGFEHREPAYKTGCVSQVCTLDADGQSCCVRRVQWWMPLLTFFAVFCCCSLLCGVGGGYIQSYADKMRKKQGRTKMRLSRSRSDESEDHSSQEGLLENEQGVLSTAMAAPTVNLFSDGSTTLPASSVI